MAELVQTSVVVHDGTEDSSRHIRHSGSLYVLVQTILLGKPTEQEQTPRRCSSKTKIALHHDIFSPSLHDHTLAPPGIFREGVLNSGS